MICNILIIEISSHPINTNVTALQNVRLHCSASVDDVTYSWHCVNGNIPSGSTGQYSDTFAILRATPHDEGMYYCIARKGGINVTSNNAAILVDGEYIPINVLFSFKS